MQASAFSEEAACESIRVLMICWRRTLPMVSARAGLGNVRRSAMKMRVEWRGMALSCSVGNVAERCAGVGFLCRVSVIGESFQGGKRIGLVEIGLFEGAE